MGISNSHNNNDLNKPTNKMKEYIQINGSTETKTQRINECIINKPSDSNNQRPFEKIDRQISNVLKSICKIKVETGKEPIFGTGFLLYFWNSETQDRFYCLMSNEHVITKNVIKNKNNIYIYYDSEYKAREIKLNEEERYIKSFKDIGLDITIVEILDKDNISKDYFLFPEKINEYNRLINSQVYIPQYPKGKELKNARGKIKEINKYEFTHLVTTEEGSSGSPIFLENSIDVIGIHKEGNKDNPENYGDFIYPAINIILKNIREKINKGKSEKGKYIWKDGKYYEGEFENNLPHGKGIKYYSNGNILYEGNFINGKFEGKGKYIYNDGDYFIGEYKNGLRNGKGILYDKNGNIMFKSDYINGKVEGYGKRIWENGEYYEGQWKNDLKHGNGKEYYANEEIKYEGNFINDKYEGNGKYIWNNGEYYIGQFKNGLSHGKGAIYYPNGKIKIEGKWIEDKFYP